jgi:hypothetical protein
MNTTMLAIALCLPSQPGGRDDGGAIAFHIGPRVQNRAFVLREFGRKVVIKGDNNTVYLYYSPDAGINYYNSQRWVNRKPLFWRFRRRHIR